MKKIILSGLTLASIVIATISCEKSEVLPVEVTQDETQTVSEDTQIEDEYAFSKELTILDETGEIETKFLVSAESEAIYNDFVNNHVLTVEYVTESTPNATISNEEVSVGNENMERPDIQIELLDNEHSLQEGVSVKLGLNPKEAQDRGYYTLYGNMSFVSSANNVTVTNTSSNYEFNAQYEFKIKWYTKKWRTHHWAFHDPNTTSNEFFGNYYRSRLTVFPLFPGAWSTMYINFF